MIDLTPIANAVISLMAIIITVILIPLIRSKLTEGQYNRLQTYIRTGVAAAEQLYKGSGRGGEKKSFVLRYLNERGFTYDPNVLNTMIEAAVKELTIAQDNTVKAITSATPVNNSLTSIQLSGEATAASEAIGSMEVTSVVSDDKPPGAK